MLYCYHETPLYHLPAADQHYATAGDTQRPHLLQEMQPAASAESAQRGQTAREGAQEERGEMMAERIYEKCDALSTVSRVLVDTLQIEEGFSGVPYPDADGQSIGYGTHLPLTEWESELLLRWRIVVVQRELASKLAGYERLPVPVRNAVTLMAYQMGVPRLGKFRNMLSAIADGDYVRAAEEALDSRWAKQTPDRAQRVASLMREGFNYVL